MSQQKHQSWEPSNALKCFPAQGSNPCVAPCSAPCVAACSAPCDSPCAGCCHLSSQKPGTHSPARRKRTRRKCRCLRGGTTYPCKEEEC
ncbi:late cornified envelope protein 6A [Tupaia chinensis]|uniref:late cornified envelope protein 6A n=1 Tax=Tupaia chinensis TaxID=246437 RepID=UPI0003C9182C|nr:late cornified envelope protein 6A [Tupaia chinensis]